MANNIVSLFESQVAGTTPPEHPRHHFLKEDFTAVSRLELFSGI